MTHSIALTVSLFLQRRLSLAGSDEASHGQAARHAAPGTVLMSGRLLKKSNSDFSPLVYFEATGARSI